MKLQKEIVVDKFREDQPQPRCNICGRFAYRDKFTDTDGKVHIGRWLLRCTYYDNYSGMYEHE